MATTTNYGWETPDDTDLVKDGALAMRTGFDDVDSTLGTALNNKLHAGLVLVSTTTIGSGVSSVTVSNAFSSTYDNYKIMVSGGVGSVSDANLELQFGSSTTGYYEGLIYQNGFTSATINGAVRANQSSWAWFGNLSSDHAVTDVDVLGPFLSKYTFFRNGTFSAINTNGLSNGVHKVATSYTAFTLIAGGGTTMTGGTIAVYGYSKD